MVSDRTTENNALRVAKADLGLLSLRGEKNPLERVAAGSRVGGIAGADLSSTRALLAGMDRRRTALDRGLAGPPCGAAAGGCGGEEGTGIAVAGISTWLSVRDSL